MKSAIQNLAKYVMDNAIRGTCRCGRCIDHPGKDEQPVGHTSDVFFFNVAAVKTPHGESAPSADELRSLIDAAQKESPEVNLFDGSEHSYISIGAWLGDQGLALMLMGLGGVLGIWRVLTPNMLPLPDALKQQMAGAGFVNIGMLPK